MVVDPCGVLKSMRTKYLFMILLSVIYFERNGSYGNDAPKLKKLSLWKSSLNEIDLNQMTINSLVFRSVWPARRSRR